jgi:uncharacterized protein YdeI (YjbR/CyaY-like superfamily)
MIETIRAGLFIVHFEDAESLETWLAAEPRTSKGVWLKLAKKGSGIVSPSRAEAVDAALCHGWIDGQQDRNDEASWLVRFTPRRRTSRWSEINRTRALDLIEAGRMQPAGFAEIEAARFDGRWDAAYPPASTAQVPHDLQAALDASPKAAAVFATTKRTGRYAIIYRISTVKRLETRARLIAEFIVSLVSERAQTGQTCTLVRPAPSAR